MSRPPLHVKFYMKSSKYAKMAYPAIEAAAAEHGCVVQKLVLEGAEATASLADCDVLVAKVTDDIVDAEQCGDAAAAARSARLTLLLSAAPQCVVVDAIATQRLVLSRAALYASLAHVAAQPALAELVAQPKFAVVEPGGDCAAACVELAFPLVAKTDLACGTPESHHMIVARSGAELAQWVGERAHARLVVQEFVSHAATVYKCFAIGARVGVNARPSIEAPLDAPLAFDSQVPLSSKARGSVDGGVERVAELVRGALAELYGFSVFGFDLLQVGGSGGRYAIVDVNYFPGFKEMVADGSFAHVLLEHAKQVHSAAARQIAS